MLHPLQTRIRSLRARLWGWLAVYALGCWLAYGIGAVVLCALADYLVRYHDPGVRVLATLSASAVLAWAAYRYAYRPWTVRWRDVDLARRVQLRFPSLGDDLASAVEFLRQADDDPTAGSPTLRQAIVARAAEASKALDLRQVVEPRPAWRAGAAAVGVGMLAALLAAADPTSAQIAMARLVQPLADIPWPQVHHLAVQNPVQRLARGQAFEVEVIDSEGARLPSEVRVFYRFQNSDGSVSEESESMRLVQGMMVARRERVTRPFSFRVEGGDDRSMPWRPVEVVDPPAIASLRVTLTPPAYTGWRPEVVEGNIRALAGTRAEVIATATKPVAAAVLVANGRDLAGRIAADGHQLAFPAELGAAWILDQSGSYGFRLTDRDGIAADGESGRWEIRVVPDAPPVVALEEPRTGDDLFVTPQGSVPLVVAASDDLAVQRVELHFSRSDRATVAPGKQSLYAGPVAPKPSRGLAATLDRGKEPRDRQAFRYEWKLSELAISPGTQVTFWLEAADYKPQTAKSERRRLTVVTPDDLSQRFASLEAAILAELSRAIHLQRRGRQQVATLEKRAAQSPRLAQLDVDQLRGVELNQRQIDQILTSHSEGVPRKIMGLMADVANNKLDQPRVRQRMEKLLGQLERLAATELPAVAREITSAIKAAQNSLDQPDAKVSPASVQTPMAAAGKHQDAVIAALERMIEELSRWDRFRGFPHEMGQLARQQDNLATRTRELARRTLTKQRGDLTPQEAAELAEAARQQAALAARLDGVQQAMEDAIRSSPTDEPAAANVAEGLRRSRELNLAGDMRSAGERIQDNQLGQAAQQQARIQEGMRDVLDRLSGRGARESGQSPGSKEETPTEDLRRMQVEINRRTEELDKAFRHSDKTTVEARRRYGSLGGDQEELGDLVRRVFGPKAEGVPRESGPQEPRKAAPPKPPLLPPQTADPKAADAVDRELFAPEPKKDTPAHVAPEPKGPATPAAVRQVMLEAARRIRATDTGAATQQMQRRIVAQLEELLQQAGQKPGGKTPQATAASGQKAKPGAESQTDPKAKPTQNQAGAQPGQTASEKQTGDGQSSGPDAKMSLVRRVWGNLPDRQREEILQLQPPEEFLPQYESQIEAYFRRLAEGGGDTGEGRKREGRTE